MNARATVFSSVCREESIRPYRAAASRRVREAGPVAGGVIPSLPPTEAAARRADALARSLCAARDRLVMPLARLAASLVRERAWCAFGYARAADFAREHFGRSSRWLRDLATLHDALSNFDELARALTGDDGGAPLGRRRVLLIARVATAPTLPAWVALARRLTVRELQSAIARADQEDATAPSAGTAQADITTPPAVAAAPSDITTLPAVAAAPPDITTPPADSPLLDSGTPTPGAAAPTGALHPEADDAEDRSVVSLAAPRAVLAAFDEAVDLHRAVEGSEATMTSFVEALVGEASAGGVTPDVERTRAERGPTSAVIEEALARSTDRWRHLPRSCDPSWGLALGRSTLARLEVIAGEGAEGTPAERVARLKELLRIENEVEIHLGRLLSSMGEQDAWNRLRFGGIGHYAEERLGLSRTTAQSRVRAARLLGCFPLLRSAYERDGLGMEAALIVGRILSSGEVTGAQAGDAITPGRAEAEQIWVRHAVETTIKRLRDESRALERSRAFGVGPANVVPPLQPPPSDSDWHASLRREPGTARRRVTALGLIALGVDPFASMPQVDNAAALSSTGLPIPALDPTTAPIAAFDPATARIPEPDVFLRLTLPDDLADSFLAAIESARAWLAGQVERIPRDVDWPGPDWHGQDWPGHDDAVGPALLAARTFSIRDRRVPAWVGLLALIEDFVATWDPDERADDVPDAAGSRLDGPELRPGASRNPSASRGPSREDAILARDGWRCAAPGCSSRRNLEVHHVVYRSRGGGDQEWNLVVLCRFHHQRGEHGGLARCIGRAPLDLTWRLGAEPSATWYLNDRRIATPQAHIIDDFDDSEAEA